jgi:hypothetical protein
MVSVTVEVRVCSMGSSVVVRYVGMTVDSTIPRDFWTVQGIPIIYAGPITLCAEAQPISIQRVIDVGVGSHYLQINASNDRAIDGMFKVEVYLGGSKVKEGYVWNSYSGGEPTFQMLNVNFYATDTGVTSDSVSGTTGGTFDMSQIWSTMKPMLDGMIQIMMTVMMVNMMISMMSSMMTSMSQSFGGAR